MPCIRTLLHVDMAERVGIHRDLGALERKDVWVLATITKRSNGLKGTFDWPRDRKDEVEHAEFEVFFGFNISMHPTETISLFDETQRLVLK